MAHFYRSPNPFNHKRTVTVLNGMFSRGTLGAVRALTERFPSDALLCSTQGLRYGLARLAAQEESGGDAPATEPPLG